MNTLWEILQGKERAEAARREKEARLERIRQDAEKASAEADARELDEAAVEDIRIARAALDGLQKGYDVDLAEAMQAKKNYLASIHKLGGYKQAEAPFLTVIDTAKPYLLAEQPRACGIHYELDNFRHDEPNTAFIHEKTIDGAYKAGCRGEKI